MHHEMWNKLKGAMQHCVKCQIDVRWKLFKSKAAFARVDKKPKTHILRMKLEQHLYKNIVVFSFSSPKIMRFFSGERGLMHLKVA